MPASQVAPQVNISSRAPDRQRPSRRATAHFRQRRCTMKAPPRSRRAGSRIKPLSHDSRRNHRAASGRQELEEVKSMSRQRMPGRHKARANRIQRSNGRSPEQPQQTSDEKKCEARSSLAGLPYAKEPVADCSAKPRYLAIALVAPAVNAVGTIDSWNGNGIIAGKFFQFVTLRSSRSPKQQTIYGRAMSSRRTESQEKP